LPATNAKRLRKGAEATKQSILSLRCGMDCFADARNDGWLFENRFSACADLIAGKAREGVAASGLSAWTSLPNPSHHRRQNIDALIRWSASNGNHRRLRRLFSRNRRTIMARKYSKKASAKVERAMKERNAGTLKSGRSGRKVTSRKQAIAIGLSEARAAGAKVPKKTSKRPAAKARRKSKA